MTIGEVKAIHGSAYREVVKTNFGEEQYFGTVRTGDREFVFRVAGEPYEGGYPRYAPTTPMKDSDVVVEISVQPHLEEVGHGGC